MHDESDGSDYGIGAELKSMRLAKEAREKGDEASAKYHDMMTRLAANRTRNLIRKLTDTTLRTEVWVADSIPHTEFEQAFKKFFPQGKITRVVEHADPDAHKGLRNVEVETLKSEAKRFQTFFKAFAFKHGFEIDQEKRSTYPTGNE